jgi:hypothetical protein
LVALQLNCWPQAVQSSAVPTHVPLPPSMTSWLHPMQAPHVPASAHCAHEVYVGVPVHVGVLQGGAHWSDALPSGVLPSPVLPASAASAAASGGEVPVLEEQPPANA